MTGRPRLRVHAHRDGPWLVILGRRRLAVGPALGRRLRDLDGCRPDVAALARRLGGDRAVARALLADPVRDRRHAGPRLRVPVLPEVWVARAAAPLGPLTGGRTLAVLALGGMALVALGRHPAGVAATTGTRAVAFLLLLATGFVHELGHAAALLREGYPPGRIGLGLLGVLPVLWCDVSAVDLLPRRGRVRVDLAGPALQLATAGLCAAVGLLVDGPCGAAAGAASTWAVLAVVWSVTPFFRADGYWVLTDLVGRSRPDRMPQPGDEGRTLVFLVTYRLAQSAFFAALATAALRRSGGDTCAGVLALAIGLVLAATVAARLLVFARAIGRARDRQFP